MFDEASISLYLTVPIPLETGPFIEKKLIQTLSATKDKALGYPTNVAP